MELALRFPGIETGTVNLCPKPIFCGTLLMDGRATAMKGGLSVSSRNSLGKGTVRLVLAFGLFPPMRKLP